MQLYSTFYHWLMFAIVSTVDAKSNCIYDLQIFNWRRQLFKSIQLFLKCTSKPVNFLLKKLREFNIKKNGKVTLGYSKPQIFHGWPNTYTFQIIWLDHSISFTLLLTCVLHFVDSFYISHAYQNYKRISNVC